MSFKSNFDIARIYCEMVQYNRNVNKITSIQDIIDGIDEYYYDDNNIEPTNGDGYEHWEEYNNPIKVNFISDENVAAKIQNQYEKAIGRTSSYVGDLYNHILSHNGEVIFDDKHESAIVGQTVEIGGVFFFVVSHFAPFNLRSGVNFIKELSYEKYPIIMAVPEYQSMQLKKAGFRNVGSVPQYFAGEYITKNIMVNYATTDYHVNMLVKYYLGN